jgi:putative endonuclease
MDRNELGRRGEEAAATYLERVGFTVLDTNWRTKAGEVDIVARDGDTLVLVEVKTRRSLTRGTPEDAVSVTKQRRIGRLAGAYLQGMEHEPAGGVRFDVVTIYVLGEDRALLRHHRAAFVLG